MERQETLGCTLCLGGEEIRFAFGRVQDNLFFLTPLGQTGKLSRGTPWFGNFGKNYGKIATQKKKGL